MKIKNVSALILLFVLSFYLFTACNDVKDEPQDNDTVAVAGFIEIQNNTLYITPVEVFVTYDEQAESGWHTSSDLTQRAIELIEKNDIQKMKEFGLTQEDFPSGICIRPNWHSEKQWYYVEQANIETLVYEITDETMYTFIDTNLLFSDESDGTRQYSTTILNEFVEYFSPTVIHIIEVKDGKVIRLVQEFAFTI